jgi:DNA-3-methyladenine glycosylase II
VRDGSHPVPYLFRVVGAIDAPAVEVTAPVAAVELVASVVRDSFVTAPDALAELREHDPVIARVDAAHPGVRPVIHREPLTALIRSISAQQVNLRWASEIRRRLAQRFGIELRIDGEVVASLDATRLASASLEELRGLQLTTAKSRSVTAVAGAARDGLLDRDELAALDDDALTARLVALPGIGPWSADWYLARTLGRPRVVAGDLGVRKAVGLAYLDGRMPSETEVRSLTAHWGAAAGVAQQLLLHDLAARGATSPVAPTLPPATHRQERHPTRLPCGRSSRPVGRGGRPRTRP